MINCYAMKTTLISALKAAGQIQKENFNKPTETIQKESHSSVVTETDLQSERAIMEIIGNAFPSHNILSEESGFSDKGSEYTWVIDPLDGTSNFAAGVPWFGVLIALFQNKNILMSGAYLPVYDELYFAEAGKGAFLNDKPFRMPATELKNSLFAFSTDFTDNRDYLNQGVELYTFVIQNSRNVRTTNSLVDLMYVAEGKFGGCINLFNRIWDIAAPHLIIKEAGGVVKSLYTEELDFDLSETGVTKNYPVISTAARVYDEVEPVLKRIFH